MAPEPSVLAAEEKEVAVSLAKELRVAPKTHERPTDIPVVVVPPETAPQPVTPEVVRAPIERETVAGQRPHTALEAEETGLAEEATLATAPEIAVKTAPALRRALPWAAVGIVAVALPCVGALVAVYMAGPISGISLATLRLPSPCPGSLLLVSGASFAAAGLLLGLLLWARRQQYM